MRPSLFDFREDGTIEIDKCVYALPQLEALANQFGKHYVELLFRLYAYRTPINPYAPIEERYVRAIADTKAKNRTAKLDRLHLNHRLWKEAVDRFLAERYDPVADAFVNYEAKCDEFNAAIAKTPVIEIIEDVKPVKSRKAGGRRRKSDAMSDPVEDALNEELDVQVVTRRVDNTELLSKMNKAYREYATAYEEARQRLLRVKTGKAALPQRAADFRKLNQ